MVASCHPPAIPKMNEGRSLTILWAAQSSETVALIARAHVIQIMAKGTVEQRPLKNKTAPVQVLRLVRSDTSDDRHRSLRESPSRRECRNEASDDGAIQAIREI